MGVQYIYDAEGRKTGVIVSIDLWDAMSSGKSANKQSGVGSPEPQKYRGIYRDLKVDLRAEIQGLRDEWDRV